jgi:uncharacterized protein (UPF0179 family)
MLLTCLLCRVVQAALELAHGEKWYATFVSMAGNREAFHGLGVQDVREFDSELCLLLIESKKKKERNGQGASFQGQTCPAGCVHQNYSGS